jgi:pimeloyl-ACP methyl ester carboxylesterase
MFADQYPDEVAGLVLVDASHPDQWARIPASRNGRTVATGNRLTALFARVGILRLFRAERSFIAGLIVLSVTEQDRYAEQLTRLSERAHAAAVSDAIRAVSQAARSGGRIPELAASHERPPVNNGRP